MPKDNLKTIKAGAPFGGLNEAVDPRLIADSELSDVSNVVIRDGRICPRPGYEEVVSDSLGLAVKRIDFVGSINVTQMAVDSTNGAAYWVENATGKIRKILFSTGAVSDIQTGLSGPSGICLDVSGNKIYFVDSAGSGNLKSCALSGGSITTITTSIGTVGNIAINTAETPDYIYAMRAASGIAKYAVDNSSQDNDFVPLSSTGTISPGNGIGVDSVNGRVYWRANDFTLRRADTSAADTNVSTLLTSTSGQLGLAVDAANSHVYYDNTGTTISRSDLSGGNITSIMSSQGGLTQVGRFAYDSTNSRLYFVDLPGSDSIIYSMTVGLSTSYPVVTEWFRRSILGVDASSYFCKDIVWAQVINTTNSNSEMSILFPSLGIQKSIQMGYHAYTGTADGSPTIWATDDRDSDPTYFDPFSTSSARCKFAWTGTGIDAAKGGWLVAQKGVGARVLNYVLSDTIWTYTETDDGGPSTGLYRFNFNNYSTTQNIPIPATAAQVRANLLEPSSAINGLSVTKSGSTFTIRLHGVWSGRDTPTLTITKNGGSGALSQPSRAQTGGLDTAASGYVGSMVYCRPAGLPRPASGPATTYQISGTSPASGTALDIGYYSFVVTWYSSRFDLESPPSLPFGDLTNDYLLITTAGTDETALITIANTGVSTMYFSQSSPFAHIDTMRVYARKWGTTSSSDGVNAWDDWYLIGSLDIGQASFPATFAWDGDPTDKTTVKVPVVNEYPPDNAALVEIHDDRAIYNSGDNLIWASELTKRGGVVDGELGGEYVSNELFNQINRKIKNDFPITAMKSHAGRLFIGTSERMLSLDMSQISDSGTVFVDPMEGTSGVANQWCLCETSPLPDMPGYLLWLSPYGHIYAFNGATSQRLSLNLSTSVDDMVKKFWIDDTYFESGLKSLHYASMVVDPVEQRILLSTWDSSGTAYNLCYSVADRAWTKWSLGGYALENGREWTGTDKGKDIIVVGLAGGKLWKLMDGSADAVTTSDTDGSSFAWYATTKKLSPTSGFYKTKWGKLAAMFNARNFSSTDASFTMTPIIGKGSLTARNETSSQKDLSCVSTNGSRAHWVQLKLSGTHTHDMDHAEFSAVVAEYDPTITGDLSNTDNDPTS